MFINDKLNQAYKSMKVKYQKRKLKGSIIEKKAVKVMDGELALNLGDDSGITNEHAIDKAQINEGTGGSHVYPKTATDN